MIRVRFLRRFLLIAAALIGTLLLGGLLFRGYAAYRLHRATKRYERQAGPLDLEVLVKPRLEPLDNAATWLRAGIGAIVLDSRIPGDYALLGDLASAPVETWTPDQAAKLETILDRNRPAIEILERARGLRGTNWDIPYLEGTKAKIPDLLGAIRAGKLLCARGRLALLRGDRETALRCAESLGSLARSLEAESSLIVLMVGAADEKYQLAIGHAFAADPRTTVQEIDRIVGSFSDQDLGVAIRRSFRGEAAASHHDLRGAIPVDAVPSWLPQSLVIGVADLCSAIAVDNYRALDASLGTPVRAPLDDPMRKDAPSWWTLLMAWHAPNLANTAARMSSSASARDVARLALAARRESLVGGRYPLNVPTVAGVPAIDPFSGAAWLYEVRPDGWAQVRSGTTEAILRSIYVPTWITYDAFYRWPLPAPGQTSHEDTAKHR